jgi:polysaccharide pyruvyl transferase CsaB
MKRVRIGICGSYGGLNLGDEAILESIIRQIVASTPADIVVFSRDPAETAQRHRVRALPLRDLPREDARREISQLDVLVVGGGGILFDAYAGMFMRLLALAHECGVPSMVYAVSAGPLEQHELQSLVSENLNRADVVTVRDREAKQLLEEIGVRTPITTTADPAVLLEPAPLAPDALDREGFIEGRPRVAFSLREPGPAAPDIDADAYQLLLANAADFSIERYGAQVIFVPMEPKTMDVQYSHAVISRMQHPQEAVVLKGEYSPGEILSIVGECNFAVGMRLHFLIFAASRTVPFVALPYASKVRGFLEEMEMEMPALENVTAGHLLATIDRSWDERRKISGEIAERFPRLQQMARETHRLLVELIDRPDAARSGGR